LALHLDCSRQYIDKFEAEGVIQGQSDGFPRDQSRVAYLRYFRRERRQSPRAEADAAHIAAKTEMLRLRLMEIKRELVPWADFDAAIDGIAGVVLTHPSGLSAPVLARHDGQAQHDAVVTQIRREISEDCSKMADECGEPPLD
jgi:hypothetical protein